jgi:urease gamma subunit
MPKMKDKGEAIRQMLYAATIIAYSLEKKGVFKNVDETVVGRGELRHILDKDRDGKGLLSLASMAAKRFDVRRVKTIDGKYLVEVIDVEKPLLKIRRLKK